MTAWLSGTTAGPASPPWRSGKPVYGTPMLEHAQLEEGLVRVRYENGYTVYVNYQAEDRECDGVSVPAQSVEVVKG